MQRLTQVRKEDGYWADAAKVTVSGNEASGVVVERLAAYENMHEQLEQQYSCAADKLETFKAQGKLRSSTAQQLLAQKLTYSSMLNLIKFHTPE